MKTLELPRIPHIPQLTCISFPQLACLLSISGNLFFHLLLWNVALGILLEVKLAPLPWNAGENRLAGSLEAFMGIADKQLYPMKLALL